jgi:hypothetical protein
MMAAMETAAAARRMWTLFEPVHVVTYFAPEARQGFEEAGLRGFWRGYFAGRAAPIGAVDAPPVIAAFFSFAPPFVRRALPAVWGMVSPEQALAARTAGAVAAIRRLVAEGDGAGADGAGAGAGAVGALSAAADLLAAATEELDMAGRPLGAPNAALPLPDDPAARLWHGATVLREHRGDGHIGALVAAGVDGCEALALRVATGQAEGAGPSREQLQPARGWTDEEWDAAADRLASRGWLGAAGAITPAGRAAHQAVEDATDVAAARPWARLGPERTEELARLLTPTSLACAAVLPFPNPVGLPRPVVP